MNHSVFIIFIHSFIIAQGTNEYIFWLWIEMRAVWRNALEMRIFHLKCTKHLKFHLEMHERPLR